MGAMTNSGALSKQLGSYFGLVGGLGVTAMAMSAGFIWASQGNVTPVYIAGFLSWTGYLIAHFSVTGDFVDEMNDEIPDQENNNGQLHADIDDAETSDGESNSISDARAQLRTIVPGDTVDAIGFITGIIILVTGIATLAWFVRQEDFLLGNLGSGMFLLGYVISHYFDSGKPL